MSQGGVAERYAQAIFELGEETNQLASLCDGFSDFARSYEQSAELRAVLTNPLLPSEKVRQILRSVAERMGIVELGLSALVVLWRRRRLFAVSEIATRLSQLRDIKEGVIRAHLTTAIPMPESYYQALTDRLAQATARRVILEHQVDPSLIAGAVARVGDSVLDASVQGRLDKFKQQVLGAIAAGAV